MAMDQYIYVKENAIRGEHCQNIISKLNSEQLQQGDNARMSRFYKGIFGVPTHQQEWFPDFCRCLEEYKNRHRFLGYGAVGHWGITPVCNYQRYEPGQCYDLEHCEHGQRENNQRVIAWMFYCNDINEGGGTHFPQQDFTATPRTGTLMLWPAGWTHSHIGLAAPKERKYIVTGWCSYI